MGNSILNLCNKCSGAEQDEEKTDKNSVSELPDTQNLTSNRRTRMDSNKYFSQQYSVIKSRTLTSSLPPIKSLLSDENRQKIEQALSTHFLFKQLDYDTSQFLISKMKCFSACPQEIIMEQGNPGDLFFVLTSGSVEIIVDNKPKTIATKGSCFGEMALITQEPRQATIKALENCQLWGINQAKFKQALAKISYQNYEENKSLLSQVKIFEDLYEDQIEQILSVIHIQKWGSDEYIFKKGEYGFQFYIIKSGSVAVIINDKKIKELKTSMYFGELALLDNSKRSASVKTLEPTTLLSLTKNKLYEILGDSLEKIKYRNCLKISIDKSATLRFLDNSQIEQIIDASIYKICSEGEVVIATGQPKSSSFAVVLDGYLLCEEKKLKKFSMVGSKAFCRSSQSTYTKNYTAGKHCIVAICYKEYLENIQDFRALKLQNKMIQMLRSVKILRLLSKEKLQAIAKATNIKVYNDNTCIIKENTPPDFLYIIKEGNAIVKRNGITIGAISKNNYFGERSILLKENRIASVIAQGRVEFYTINKDTFLSIIDKGTKAQMLKRLYLYEQQFDIDNLVPLEVLNKGVFTRVVLCLNKNNNAFYTVKCARKDIIKKFNIGKFLDSECNILKKLDNPLILKLVTVIDDEECVFIVSEFIQGSSLYHVLKTKRRLNEEEAKFYICSMVIVLEHLHKKHIVHRDLKLENIRLDEEGYVKVIDFGSSKAVKGRTFTAVGTPHYMAPEVIKGTGHSRTADLWSLGVIMYELLFGKLPFGDDSYDIQEVYKEILENPVHYPENITISQNARSLLNQLLNKAMHSRNPDITSSLNENPWLNDIDINEFLAREVAAPFVPKLRNLDLLNFNNSNTLKDVLNQEFSQRLI